jgi:hypothetical protein
MTKHLIGLGDEAPRDTSPTLTAQQSPTITADALNRLKSEQTLMRVVAEHNERALLVEIQRLTAERDALRVEVAHLRIYSSSLDEQRIEGDAEIEHLRELLREIWRTQDPDGWEDEFAAEVSAAATPKDG